MSTDTFPAGPGGTPPSTFTVGDIHGQILSDGFLPYEPAFLCANAPEDELLAALEGRLDEQGMLSTPYHCVLVETSAGTALIDTGLGRAAAAAGAPAGKLLETLAAAGINPADIDVVVLSHAHPDHIGGLAFQGELTFPAARHVMSADEWNFWTSATELARLPDILADPAREVLPQLQTAGVLDLAVGETDVLPGVQLVPAPGHTVGHCVVRLTSGTEQAVFLADSVLDDLQFTHPEWVSAVEAIPERTVTTRAALLDRAADDQSLVFAYHVPGLGHVESHGGTYAFVRT
jgi:glyoxylase-like metal-dependent hydrolase (beta-lactamase superfamily II)